MPKQPSEPIREFKGKWEFLSNFYLAEMTYAGVVYPTSEHAFQAAKARTLEDKLWVAGASTPGQAKQYGRRIALRKDWEDVKLPVMRDIVSVKFSDDRLGRMLVGTGDVELIEGNYWHDQFWGDCICAKHLEKPGKNKLGLILNDLRDRLVRPNLERLGRI